MLNFVPRLTAPAVAVAAVLCAVSQNSVAQDDDLFELSLEELVNMSVTSVSRRAESLADTTSAAFVITREDLERQGIRTIPDALRLAPGLSVLQIDANKWAIGARGQTGRFANKLLVLMDGRILYTPTFSGVFWDVQSTLIEEIERIEVIRGPGAAVWGSNAVNGVINIITRRPDGTDGGAVIAGTDPESAPFAALQFNGSFSESGGWRAFAKYQEGRANETQLGQNGDDDWDLFRAGYRASMDLDQDQIMFSAEAYTGRMGQSFVQFAPQPPYQSAAALDSDVRGGFMTGDWRRNHDSGSATQVQAILDLSDRDGRFDVRQTSLTLDAQHQWSRGQQEWIAGGQVRLNEYDIGAAANYSLTESIDNDRVVAGFVQNEITITPDRLSVTVGTKLEHNSLSPKSLEVMPTARVLWKPRPSMSVWAGASRAVRTPSVGDLAANVQDVQPAIAPGDPRNPFPVPLRSRIVGNNSFGPETLYAYETGVRGRISESVSYDLAAFVFDYNSLRSVVPVGVSCDPGGASPVTDPLCIVTAESVIADAVLVNGLESRVTGGELSLNWIASDTLRVAGFVAYSREDLGAGGDSVAEIAGYPELQATLRADWMPLGNVSVGALLRYVDDIDSVGAPGYTQANVNLRWAFHRDWVLSAGVRNLLDDSTLEYRSELFDVVTTEIERAAYVNFHYGF